MMARLHETRPRFPYAIVGFPSGRGDGTVSQCDCLLQKGVSEQARFIYLQKHEITAQVDVDNVATIWCVR